MTHPLNPCGHRTPHTSRVGCCAGCRRLFSSDTAFMQHRRNLTCHDPAEMGLVPRPSRQVPTETVWALPGSYDRAEAS
jgi:hypothetical protein